MITVSYLYSTWSPCGDMSCCSDSSSTVEFLFEDGTRQDTMAPIMSNAHELKLFLEQYKKHYDKYFPGEEFYINEDECQWY